MIKQAPFKPTDIGGCQLWLDGADRTTTGMTLSGSSVTSWNDKSGNARNLSASSAYPTITSSGLLFNGATPNVLSNAAAFAAVNGINSFVVFNSTVAATRQRVFMYVYTGQNIGYVADTTFNTTYSSTIGGDGGVSYLANTTYIYGGNTYSTSPIISHSENAVETQYSPTYSVNTSGQTQLLVGGQSTVYFTGTIKEVILYDAFLTISQRQQIESYLAQKWGLRQQLPQGHPGTQGIVYPSQPIPTAIYWRYQNIFLPTSINNLVLWLDAADTSSASMILSGSNVTTWKDKSGTGNNATANTGTVTTNSTQINGLNTIRFATSSFLYIASFAMTTNISVFAVLRGVAAQGTGPKGYFFLGNGAQPSFFVYTLPPANGNLAGPFSGWVASTGETNWYMPSSDYFLNNTGFIYTDNNSSFVNGSQLTLNPNRASVPNTVTAGTYSIQVGGRSASDSIDFDFAECLFYNRTITTTERQQVEGYLAWKWGLQANLPANHPYKNSSPSTTNPAGISRPANVLPVPSITGTPVSKIRTLVTQVFSYTGALQTYSVPAGVTSVVLYMWGAGGGTSQPVGGFVNYSGGAGAMVQGVYPVTPASTLYVVVGKGGVTNQSTQTDAQGGGGGANSAGGGGGRSAIQLTSGGADVVVAGGGGGGGLLYANNNGTGGPAYFSGSSPNTLAAVVCYGGTQTAGGAAGGNGNVPGNPGTLKFGGAGTGLEEAVEEDIMVVVAWEMVIKVGVLEAEVLH